MLRVLVPSKSDEQMEALLSSMERCQQGSSTRVCVGDNGLSASFRVKWWQPSFIPLPKEPFVFAKAINTLADAAAPMEDLLILGDDTTILTPHWLNRLDAFMERWPREYGLLSLRLEGRGAGAVEDQKIPEADGPGGWQRSNWTVCFVAALIPRRVWRLVGRMDERFIGYGHDDDDYCLRLWHEGLEVGVTNAASVFHGRGTYAKGFPGQEWESLYEMNSLLFGEKWGIQYPGRKGLSCGDEHRRCAQQPWHRMP